jgi:hypothetical protein
MKCIYAPNTEYVLWQGYKTSFPNAVILRSEAQVMRKRAPEISCLSPWSNFKRWNIK